MSLSYPGTQIAHSAQGEAPGRVPQCCWLRTEGSTISNLLNPVLHGFFTPPISWVYGILFCNVMGCTEGRTHHIIHTQSCGGQEGPENHPSLGAQGARPAHVTAAPVAEVAVPYCEGNEHPGLWSIKIPTNTSDRN